ncbi:MAG TPA: glutamate 5-kinase [Devosia sp.]|nr:glutamate 5-kinase [Devosia sp.]
MVPLTDGSGSRNAAPQASRTGTLARMNCLVIKIGSALLVDTRTGALKRDWLTSLCADIADLKRNGHQIVIVSSGAIALGRAILNLPPRALPLPQVQAAACVGQVALSEAWRDALREQQITTAQILLTPNITEERRSFINARATISTLLAMGVVPVINENDSVATAEIRYGDNDRLSARVASMIGADGLVLLSDVDGLYSAPPDTDPDATHLPLVRQITPEIRQMARGAASHLSRGGMATKIDAATIATRAGTSMLIAKGTIPHPLDALNKGARHTLFPARHSPAAARKRWILGTLDIHGTIHVDAGAAAAILSGKSLLPVGVTRVRGEFDRGDAVSVKDPQGTEIARGLAGMNRDEADMAKGKKNRIVKGMFGHMNRAELIHADNLVLIATPEPDNTDRKEP